MSGSAVRICALATLALMLCGCWGVKPPILLVQTCVHDNAGAAQLLDELRVVASSSGMQFVDNSSAAKRDLEIVGYSGRERDDGSPVINVDVRRSDGMGVSAINVGLPGYQIALGFSEGSDQLEARRFADDVVKRLEQHWQVEKVPPGSGALPKPGCK
jgi:hypothetical protein